MPGKSHGPRSLVGFSPWDRKESDMTERLDFVSFSFKILSCFYISADTWLFFWPQVVIGIRLDWLLWKYRDWLSRNTSCSDAPFTCHIPPLFLPLAHFSKNVYIRMNYIISLFWMYMYLWGILNPLEERHATFLGVQIQKPLEVKKLWVAAKGGNLRCLQGTAR